MGGSAFALFSQVVGTAVGLKGLLTKAPKAPKVSGAAVKEIDTEAKKSRRRRASLFETEGGVGGQELQPSQVAQRQTILGN